MTEKSASECERVKRSASISPTVFADELRRIAPQTFEDGKINFETLKALLEGKTVVSDDERFYLNWAGKNNVFKLIQTPTYGTLKPERERSVEWDKTENLVIIGENLEALKLLLNSYFESVKCIYIDPPYNLGSDLIYRDNFSEPVKNYLEKTGQTVGGVKLTSNPETGGRYHSDWLTSLYPRLFLAKNLLTPDGAIFVSVDDHELHNLRAIMNTIFGEENFVAVFVWEGALKNDSRLASISHDYIVCYAKDREHLKTNHKKWRTRKEGIDAIYEKVEELKQSYGKDYSKITEALEDWYQEIGKKHLAFRHKHYDKVDERGVYFPGDISWPGGGGPRYVVLHPITKKPVKIPSQGWRLTEEKMGETISQGRVDFGEDETTVPTLKRYLHETEGQVLPSVIYKDRRAAKKRLMRLFGSDVFDYPKDEDVLMTFIEALTTENDLILDFFAGSGSTGHAVWKLNELDGENRKFILVQLDEPVDANKETGKNALKLGFKTIADICISRLERVSKELTTKVNKSTVGFKVFSLSRSNFNLRDEFVTDGKPEADENKQKYLEFLGAWVDAPLVSGYREFDVVYEVLLKEGFDLNSTLIKKVIGVNNFFHVIDNQKKMELFVCLDKHIAAETIAAICSKPYVCFLFVFLDGSLLDSDKINLKNSVRLKVI